MRNLHLADQDSRDAYIRYVAVRPSAPPERVAAGRPISLRRFIAAGEANTLKALQQQYGDKLGESLLNSDPEVDFELVGKPIERTSTVYLDNKQQVLRFAPDVVEVILDPSGKETDRREPIDRLPNIAEQLPIRFTKTRLNRNAAVRRFVFTRTLQLWHNDGLTYEYLFDIAKELHDSDEMVMVAGGERLKDPLIFQLNGLPWRAFLEGRINSIGYCLLLHLSNLELKALPT